MAVLLIVSESGPPPADSPLARSLATTDGPWTTGPNNPEIAATIMLDSERELRPEAISVVLAAFDENPSIEAIYGDSIMGGVYRRRAAWSGVRLLANPTDLDHVAVRGTLGRGGLADRLTAITAAARSAASDHAVGHIPTVLTHGPPAPALDDRSRTVIAQAALTRGQFELESLRDDRFRLAPRPLHGVSVIIPTAGTPNDAGRPLVLDAIAACLATGADLEILVVVGDEYAGDPSSLVTDPCIRIVRRPTGDWNFSAAVNLGLLEATKTVVLVLNDDVELIEPDWLARMYAHLGEPRTGAVGALLLYPDRTCQHVGMIADDAFPLHPYVGRTIAELEAVDADLAHDCIAVTAACLLGFRESLLEVGGFSEDLPFGFNDVDLCYKLRRAGMKVVVEPAARLIHHESASRPPVTHHWEWDRFVSRWGEVLDPWYHPGHHRPDDPHDRRRNADHLDPAEPYADSSLRTTKIRSRVHHARLGATDATEAAR